MKVNLKVDFIGHREGSIRRCLDVRLSRCLTSVCYVVAMFAKNNHVMHLPNGFWRMRPSEAIFNVLQYNCYLKCESHNPYMFLLNCTLEKSSVSPQQHSVKQIPSPFQQYNQFLFFPHSSFSKNFLTHKK